jgi:terminase large subunit-like protein
MGRARTKVQRPRDLRETAKVVKGVNQRLTFENTILRMKPTKKQQTFLDLHKHREVFYGGAAGGGKSIALLMAALEYITFPGYAALIIRKDISRLGLAGGLLAQTQALFHEATTARWNASRRCWIFPLDDGVVGQPPATLTFGYLSGPLDKFRYASSEFQYIAFDELTDFSEEDYLFLFSRLRKSRALAEVPLRMRSASNPGGRGHAWVKERFIPDGAPVEVQGPKSNVQSHDAKSTLDLGPWTLDSALPPGVLQKHGRFYVPSRIDDNPHLDGEEYRQSLLHLPPVERERLLNGDWSVQKRGQFHADWLRYFYEVPGQVELHDADERIVATIPEGECWRFMTIDPAGTEAPQNGGGRGPSWSVIQVWDQPRRERSKFLLLRHQERGQMVYSSLCEQVQRVHGEWRVQRAFVEGERLGKAVCSTLAKKLEIECIATGNKSKLDRAAPLIMKMQRGEVFLPRLNTTWRRQFEAELLAWTGDKAEPADQIDAAAYAARVSTEREGEVVKVIRMS